MRYDDSSGVPVLDDRSNPWLLSLVSRLVFRLPGRAAAKLAEFAHTEYGSGLDMLEAVDHADRPALRRLYFRHALDELDHARRFRERAARWPGRKDAALAILTDHARVADRGIHGVEPLCRRLPEAEFLAFVWIHETHGERQFRTYAGLMRDDPESQAMFTRIFQDERFHIAYSRKELDRLAAEGRGVEVDAAIRAVRTRRTKEAGLRLAHGFGEVMARLWLGLAYLGVVGPTSLLARLSERSTPGLVARDAAPADLARAAAEQA